MGFLKNLFKRKEEVEEVDAEGLDNWFLKNASDRIKEIDGQLEDIEEEIAGQRKRFEKAIAELRKSPMSLNAGEILDKEAFLRRAIDFLSEFHFVADSDGDNLMKNFDSLMEAQEEFTKGSSKHLDAIEDYFQDEIGEMNFATKGLQQSLEKISSLINEERGLNEIRSLRKHLGMINKTDEMRHRISLEINQRELAMQKQKEFVQKLERQIADLARSPEYNTMEEQRNSLSRLDRKLKDNEKTLQDRLMQLERVTRSFASLSMQNVKLLVFMKEPGKIIEDPTLTSQVLDSIKTMLNSEIDTRQRQKALEMLNGLSKEYLESLHGESLSVTARRREINFKLRLDKSSRELEDASYKLDHAHRQLKKMEDDAAKLQAQLGKIDVEKVKIYLGNKLGGFLGRKIIVK